MSTVTDDRIYELAKQHLGGKGHDLIWQDDPRYAAACDMPKDARWSKTNVTAEQTLAFARALLAEAGEPEALRSEVERLKRGQKTLGECIHNMTVANQSAWIEWQHGEGAEAAMIWIHNGLAGPGLIPSEDEPYGKEAQAWYDANNAHPLPQCKCGRPSNIGWMSQGFCCEAHYREAKAAHDATTGAAQ